MIAVADANCQARVCRLSVEPVGRAPGNIPLPGYEPWPDRPSRDPQFRLACKHACRYVFLRQGWLSTLVYQWRLDPIDRIGPLPGSLYGSSMYPVLTLALMKAVLQHDALCLPQRNPDLIGQLRGLILDWACATAYVAPVTHDFQPLPGLLPKLEALCALDGRVDYCMVAEDQPDEESEVGVLRRGTYTSRKDGRVLPVMYALNPEDAVGEAIEWQSRRLRPEFL